MKRYFRKVGILIIVSMMVCILDRANPGQAASAWSFSAGSGKKIPVNGTVVFEKNEYQNINLYKNGKEIKENDATYTVSWSSSDSDVVWVNQMSGKLRADKFGKISTDTAQAKITATIKNKKTGVTAKRSFIIRVEEKVAPTVTLAPIQPLGMVRDWPEMTAVNGVEPYEEFWGMGQNYVSGDLSDATAVAYSLTFSDKTKFSGIPNGFNPEKLLEWGKSPGLNMDILHKYGYTGKGATIAYIDQPIDSHEQYKDVNLHYVNNTSSLDSMHGPAVLSLLAGKEIGTAPEAEVYYYGHASWYADQTTHAECLYQIIEQNKSLGENEKITMVGFSDNIDSSEQNVEAFEEAVQACTDAGIMVWFCEEYGAGAFLPLSDKNDYHNLIGAGWWNGIPSLVMVPAGGRTTAATWNDSNYIYWGSAGLSWTMPYVLGLYAIAVEINPALTQDELRTLLVDTAYNNQEMPVVNPVGFVAEVLKGVGRTKEAQAMLDEVAARSKYMYAVMDTAAMSKEDLEAVGGYLATITDATVLVADAAAFSSAEELYAALQKDAKERGGKTVGVQLFGTADMVPAFQVQYKVQMLDAVDDGGMFLSDLFYGNFDNDAKKIANSYNVLDHFAEGWDVELAPDWPVARLPLSKGEYKAFFEKYENFVEVTGLERQELVNFSNPIFASNYHTDDMGTFLNRMNEEFELLDIPYRLYGNQKGQYPVNTEVIGGFTAKNLSAENKKGIAEFVINSHGQADNIDNCYFENGDEIRESLINRNNINEVLNNNPYYLDCWTCNNGFGMRDNLTTTALNGNCVGMFSATTIISNNGVNCYASVDEMAKSNFYCFYYHYLKALHDGETRSEAFCVAQKAYAEALIADSMNGIRPGEGNYQFNLCNLLAYHNFGVLEPNRASAAFEAEGYIAQAGQSVPKVVQGQNGSGQSSLGSSLVVTDGKPVGEPMNITWGSENNLKSGEVNVHSCTAEELDNGYIRFTIDFTARQGMPISIFDPPNGERFMMIVPTTSGERENIIYDVKVEDVQEVITMRFNFVDDDCYFLFLQTREL